MQRRLAAILAADVVGYSRLMGANEVGTLIALKAHRAELIDAAIRDHGGRIVKLTGDGILAEFASVVSAVASAVEIQTGMVRRNAEVPEDRKIRFRMGVNLGDVIAEDGDIFGDGVNIAARIEGLARPGGIALSGAAREQLGRKLDLAFEDGGAQSLKNIDRPVPVFHVVLVAGGDAGPGRGGEVQAAPPQASVAVLPFTNMSGDPEQDYFADGISEDIITDLSKLSGLFVVGRNSAFVYKGRAVDLKTAARELGVRHILEGSVRKAGQRVRITAQLIDGATGGHVWADRYDRDLTDIFAVQDDIARTILAQLKVRLLPREEQAIGQAPTESVEAYTLYLRGRQLFHMRGQAYLEEACGLFRKAIELDARYGRAYAGLADCLSRMREWHGVETPLEELLALADRALELEPDLPEAHSARGLALEIGGRDTEAAAEYQKALDLDPMCYEAHHCLGRYYYRRQDDALSPRHYLRALELRQDDYRSPLLLHGSLTRLGEYEAARTYMDMGLRRAEAAAARDEDHLDPLELGAAVLAAEGQAERARDWLNRALARRGGQPVRQNYNVVCTLAILGEVDRALDELEIFVRAVGPRMSGWMQVDPDLDPIRDHPRFRKLLGQAE